jgi:hypothetical protein
MIFVRHIFTTASFLLCVLLIALWGRSTAGDDYTGFVHVNPDHSDDLYKLYSARGSIGLFVGHASAGSVPAFAAGWYFETSLAPNTTREAPPGVVGFRYGTNFQRSADGTTHSVSRIMVPYALFIALTAIPPTKRIRNALRRTERQASGCCLSCGYDLRGSAIRCPECGELSRAGNSSAFEDGSCRMSN